jgi:hypothetical protein
MRALIFTLAAVLTMSPLAAQSKKPAASNTKTAKAPSKPAPKATTQAKSTPPPKAKTQAKSRTSSSKSSAKKKAPVVATQQHPTQERYTEIEQALVDRGYLAEAKGRWGAEAVSALKKFQQDQELPVDGKLGALSLTALGLGPRRGAFVVAPVVPVNSGAPVAAD